MLRFPQTFWTLRPLRQGLRSPTHYTYRPFHWQALPLLPDSTLPTFCASAFLPSLPRLLPRTHFLTLPAITKWFHPSTGSQPATFNQTYLRPFDATIVPVEHTVRFPSGTVTSFRRAEAPLSFFLSWLELAQSGKFSDGDRFYIAQASLSGFPQLLQDDLPIPDIVNGAGKGDVYDTNLWMGLSPTYTPLHRDPNPNLFVQLAGDKLVRLMSPERGIAIFEAAQRKLGKGGDGRFRGEEMMKGEEEAMLKSLVWEDEGDLDGIKHRQDEGDEGGWEGVLGSGDGLFIPKGWWHSVKGFGEGASASVNWWFR